MGKIVTLSIGLHLFIDYTKSLVPDTQVYLGGATGAATFSSDSQAQAFANTIWNLFLGGSSSTRPFGNAVLDGYELNTIGSVWY